VERNDYVLEKNDVFVPEWNRKSTNDTSKNIEKLSSTIEFMSFMDKGIEAFVDSLSNHFSSWNKFGV
jgi:hypothetical protein